LVARLLAGLLGGLIYLVQGARGLRASRVPSDLQSESNGDLLRSASPSANSGDESGSSKVLQAER